MIHHNKLTTGLLFIFSVAIITFTTPLQAGSRKNSTTTHSQEKRPINLEAATLIAASIDQILPELESYIQGLKKKNPKLYKKMSELKQLSANLYMTPHVQLFPQHGRLGRSIRFNVGSQIPDLGQSGWEDKISSFRIVGDIEVIFFEHRDYGGRKYIFHQTGELSPATLDKGVSSLVVRKEGQRKSGVILFEHPRFGGESIYLKRGTKIRDLKKLKWDNRISSMKLIGKNTKVSIYERNNFRGEKKIISAKEVFHLQNCKFKHLKKYWDDRISSIKVH